MNTKKTAVIATAVIVTCLIATVLLVSLTGNPADSGISAKIGDPTGP